MSIELSVDYQLAEDLEPSTELPTSSQVVAWIQGALAHIDYRQSVEVCLRVVTEQESQSLNYTYRNKDSATNVLSFESDIPDYIESSHIGDLVICASVVEHEAKTQQKLSVNHWAHMCVHGLLHLLGHDHVAETDALHMESLETAILAELGIGDPYQIK